MSDYIECPSCHNPTYNKEALLCPYCGGSLGRSAGFMGFIKSPKGKLLASVIGLLLIIALFILCTL